MESLQNLVTSAMISLSFGSNPAPTSARLFRLRSEQKYLIINSISYLIIQREAKMVQAPLKINDIMTYDFCSTALLSQSDFNFETVN